MDARRTRDGRRAGSAADLAAVVLWMAGALLSFCTIAVGVREVAPALGVAEILAARNLVGILVVVAAALAQRAGGAPLPIAARRMRLHLARNVFHFGGTYGWSLGLTLLPFATVFALEFTSPAWVAVFAALFLGERLTSSRLVAVGLGIVGVLVILRPGLEALSPGALIVLAAAFGFAGGTVATKALTGTETTLSILFWMNLMQLPMNLVAGRLVAAFGGGGEHVAFAPHHGVALGLVCLGGLASHWCVTNAYRHGDAITVLPLDFLRVPLIALVGALFYGEALDPRLFLGAGIIVAGILWNLRAEARAAPPVRAARGAGAA